MPSPTTHNLSPFELFHHTKPQYNHLHTFGCACFPLKPPHDWHKLQPKTKTCVIIRYSDNYKGYKCLDPSTSKVIISRHLTFDEHHFPFLQTSTASSSQNNTMPPSLLTPYSVQHNSQTNLKSPTPIPTPPTQVSRDSLNSITNLNSSNCPSTYIFLKILFH